MCERAIQPAGRRLHQAHGLRPWASRWSVVGVMWLVCCGCVFPLIGASGQVVVDAEDGDTHVLALLGDDDYQVRQAATRRLLRDNALTQADLDRLYAASKTPEQRHRLLRVARHHVIRRMIRQKYDGQAGPGSMGLSHQVIPASQDRARTGVLVVMTLPGFPAYAALEPGDVMIDFAGQPLPDKLTAAQFPLLIQEHTAGEQIHLTVLRDGVEIDVLFILEHGQALKGVYDTGGVVLNAPYRDRWATTRARMQALIGEGGGGPTDKADAAPPDPPQ